MITSPQGTFLGKSPGILPIPDPGLLLIRRSHHPVSGPGHCYKTLGRIPGFCSGDQALTLCLSPLILPVYSPFFCACIEQLWKGEGLDSRLGFSHTYQQQQSKCLTLVQTAGVHLSNKIPFYTGGLLMVIILLMLMFSTFPCSCFPS